MKERLLLLEQLLKNISSPVNEFLNKGIDEEEKNKLIRLFNENKVPNDIFEIYNWHNGTATNFELPMENFYLFPTYYLLSINEIDEILQINFFNFNEQKLLPILSSGHGEYLAISLKLPHQIFLIQFALPDLDTCTSIYDNINVMLETIILCYERKYFYIEQDSLLDMDFDKSWALSKKMNPNSDYWKS